ncbi:transcriptional repressor LexA [Seleniivibrio woodruffii]|uniref:SOS-response transcriptional repressor LexA n=1 Tax=Seleniivibrio woodruffii TaxID=1078050 RepID=A0A4R1K8X2_9BACT|nr:transcriptional repressor LexA [Seleniivibrio woodruffii]TCK60785.1 SOS-response transcriptional repressor LexA [Seleniivibrio woodruffii]TVZ36415.1 repressor LexA [Seleniivibrio woodruffii]
MTERQKMFVKFIDNFIKDNGYSPSVREIAKGMGLSSTASVKTMLDRLTESGALKRAGNVARSLDTGSAGVPVLGRIKAGVPVTSEENIEGYIRMDRTLSDGHFFLRVDGESMKDKAILDGDCVLIRQTEYIEDGQIGAFRLNGEVTLKTFERTSAGIFLMPANPDFAPIPVTEYDDFQVIGSVKMVIRSLEGGYDIEPA